MATFREVTADLAAWGAAWSSAPVIEDFNRNGLLELVDAAQRRIWEVGPGFEVALVEGPVRKTGATGALISIYTRDPDGNLIEIARPA